MQEVGKFLAGLDDVHKVSISVAVSEPERTAVLQVGKVVHNVSKLLKLFSMIGTAEQLHLHRVYNAGPLRGSAILWLVW